MYACACIFYFSTVGGGKGASKIKGMNEKDENWGGAKPEHFDARKGNHTWKHPPPPYEFFNFDSSPPPFGVEFFS